MLYLLFNVATTFSNFQAAFSLISLSVPNINDV